MTDPISDERLTQGAMMRLFNNFAVQFANADMRMGELEKALAEISQQPLSEEIDEDGRDHADYETGYNECIRRARAALEGK